MVLNSQQQHWKQDDVGFITNVGTDMKEAATGQLKEMLQGPLKNLQMCPQEKELALVIQQTTKTINIEQVN